jgi:hypothetical protein
MTKVIRPSLLAVLILAIAAVSGAAPLAAKAAGATFVQATAAENANAYTITLAYPAPVAAGDLLVAFDRNYDDFGGHLSDSLNGAWTMAVDGCSSWDVIWYKAATKGGNDIVTLTSAQHGYNRLAIAEYSGLAGTLVATGSSTGIPKGGTCGITSAVASSSQNNPTASVPAGDLVVGGFEATSTKTAVASASTCGDTGTVVRAHSTVATDGSIYFEDGTTVAGAACLGLKWSSSIKWWADTAVFA